MRSFLKWTLAVQLVGWAFVSASAQSPQCPLRPNPGTVVLDQLSLSSQNGSLSLGLTMQNAADAFGYMHYCFDYAGSGGTTEAPTLRLNPGDTLTLDLTDQLNVNPLTINAKRPLPMNMVHTDSSSNYSSGSTDPCQSQIMDYNTTNIHFHGLNVPPVCHQDDVINTLIQPSLTPFRYQIQIPANEPPGLYWYHPHPHGYTAVQVNGGAAGAIIINGIEKIKPQVAGLTERVFMIRQQYLHPLSWIPGPYQLTLNFQPALAPASPSPIIQMKPGEKQFWRVANATTQAFLNLQVLFGTAAQTLEVIALDGVPVTGDPMVTSINIPPAGRAEFIVTGPPVGAAATFVDNAFNTGPVGNANPAQVLASVVPTTTAIQQPVAVVPAAPVPPVTQRFSGLAAITATTQRKLYFSEAAIGTNPPVNFFITVDGQQPRLFTKDEPPAIVTKVGAVEDWTIENHTSEEHAFHMHQIHFLVLAVNGIPVANPTMQDTFPVPFWAGSGPYPSIRVRMDFRDPNIAGTFLYHCHILDHEDAGMMAKIRVDP
jgi:FtsP/CotA-like multicopper oxidase with cupredoxin domain